MRSSNSESVRLRSMMEVCNCSRLRSCTIVYAEYTITADSVTASPANKRIVGDRPCSTSMFPLWPYRAYYDILTAPVVLSRRSSVITNQS